LFYIGYAACHALWGKDISRLFLGSGPAVLVITSIMISVYFSATDQQRTAPGHLQFLISSLASRSAKIQLGRGRKFGPDPFFQRFIYG
jgi:hypothetical protein